MQSVLYWLRDFVRSRTVNRTAESLCRAYALKVFGLLATVVWQFPDDLQEAALQFWVSHGTDSQAWGVAICVIAPIFLIVLFELARRDYKKNRKEAEWRTPVFRLR